MTPVVDNSYGSEAISQLLTQFANSPKLQALVNAYSAQVQVLETAIWQAIYGHNLIPTYNGEALPIAYGQALDDIGVIVGVARNGLSDTDYLTAISLQITINASDGTAIALYNILAILQKLQSITGTVIIRDYYPASFTVSISNPTTPGQIANAIFLSKPAGVAANLETWFTPDEDLFVFSDSYGTVIANARGFDDSYGTTGLQSYFTWIEAL